MFLIGLGLLETDVSGGSSFFSVSTCEGALVPWRVKREKKGGREAEKERGRRKLTAATAIGDPSRLRNSTEERG